MWGSNSDKHLTWKHHISHVSLKITRDMGIIPRLKNFTPFSTSQHIYRSLTVKCTLVTLICWMGLLRAQSLTAWSYLEKSLVLHKWSVHLKLIQSLLYFFPDVPQEKVIKVIPDDLLSPSSEVGPSNITSKQPNTDTSRPIEWEHYHLMF